MDGKEKPHKSISIAIKWVDGLNKRIEAAKIAAENLKLSLEELDRYKGTYRDGITISDQ